MSRIIIELRLILITVFLCISSLCISNVAWSGMIGMVEQTDFGSNRLVIFWDTRGRDTLFQIANISDSDVSIHVQIWNINSPFLECEECDFDDMLTGHDTHVYDIENMTVNSGGSEVCTQLGPGLYGFAVISLESGDPNSLVGVVRIRDEQGYEYRANAASPEDSNANVYNSSIINFNGANGNILSDLIGITYVSINSGDTYASPGVSATFGSPFEQNLIWDDLEDDISCAPTTFACAVGQMDKGIDNALPNSLGQQNRVCASSTLDSHDSGWLDMPFVAFTCSDPQVGNDDGECQFTPYFVGFIGLNNGDGTGSMDSWWSVGGNQQ